MLACFYYFILAMGSTLNTNAEAFYPTSMPGSMNRAQTFTAAPAHSNAPIMSQPQTGHVNNDLFAGMFKLGYNCSQ